MTRKSYYPARARPDKSQISYQYPSERYANILKVLPVEKQKRIAGYVDEAHRQGDPPSLYGARSWKQLVQHLVEYESGTPYAIDRPPISDYVTYWAEQDFEHGRVVTA